MTYKVYTVKNDDSKERKKIIIDSTYENVEDYLEYGEVVEKSQDLATILKCEDKNIFVGDFGATI